MKKFFIVSVPKKECPPEAVESYSFDKIPSELWNIWRVIEGDSLLTPEEYVDYMDRLVDSHSKESPEYIWDWYMIDTTKQDIKKIIDEAIGWDSDVESTSEPGEYYIYTNYWRITTEQLDKVRAKVKITEIAVNGGCIMLTAKI